MKKISGTIEKSIQASADKTYTAVLWDESITDRAGEKYSVDSFSTKEFDANPVVLWAHDHAEPVGRATRVWKDGGRLMAEFVLGTSVRALELAKQIADEIVNAVSLGFIARADGQNEILEFSIVAVPANPGALIVERSFSTVVNQPKEASQMATDIHNVPAELVPVTAAKHESLAQLVVKNASSILQGNNFRTKAAVNPVSGPNTDVAAAVKLTLPAEFKGFAVIPEQPSRLIDFVQRVETSGQSVSFIRLGSANPAGKTKELAVKSEIQINSEPVTAALNTYAAWVEASKQILADAAGLEAAIATVISHAVRARVDADLVAEVNANGAAFVASGSVLQDSMLEAQAQVISNGGSNPIVLVNPADYVKAMTAKASTAGSYLGTPQGLGTIVASSSVTAGKLIAFDPSALTLFIRQDYELFVGYQGDQFVRNALTLLGELRAVPSVIMPALVVHGNLAKA